MELGDANQKGASLRRIDERLMRPASTPGVRRLWFQGDEPYFDVTLEVDDDGALRFVEFTWRGQSVTLDVDRDALATGLTNEREIAESLFPASKTITPDTDVRRAFVAHVASVLDAASDPALHAAAHALRAKLAAS